MSNRLEVGVGAVMSMEPLFALSPEALRIRTMRNFPAASTVEVIGIVMTLRSGAGRLGGSINSSFGSRDKVWAGAIVTFLTTDLYPLFEVVTW